MRAPPKKPIIKESPKPRGRPSLYKPEYCDLLVDHMSKGLSFESFAGHPKVRVARSTIYEWLENQDFSDAYKKGEAASSYYLENMALATSLNPKDYPSQAGVWVFTLKNRLGWRDKMDVEQDLKLTNTNQEDEKAIANKLIEAVKLAHAIV